MSARVRQQSAVSAGPSNASRSSTGNSTLPPYQLPSFGLTPNAQRQLAALTQAHNLKKLDRHLTEAQAAVTNAAGDINDRVSEIEKASKKRKHKDAEEDGEEAGGEDVERRIAEMKDKVDRMTQRMDESMRKLIDGQHSVQHLKESVGSTSEHVRINASTQASTQARTQRRRTTVGDAEDDEDEEYQDFEPTDPAAGTQAQPSAIQKFRADMETAKSRYQAHSLTSRYAENNDYRNFKRLVHDAQHHDDGKELAHESEWFPEGERPAPGVTTRRARAADEDADSDDDIAVSRATVSTKCPLTLQEFKNPLTSTKCPHSFEKEPILQMISQSRPVPVDGGRVAKAVQCPVSGCSKMLTKESLQVDNVLIRKIQRLQKAARLAEEEDADEDGVPRTQGVATFINDEDDDADVDDINEGTVKATQVKGEPAATARSAPRPSQRAGGGVVDLGDDSSDEEAEEGDEEMDH